MGDTKSVTSITTVEMERAAALETEELLVPRRCTLDGFAEEASRRGGMDLAELPALTRLEVQTQNTAYEVTLLSPLESKVLIRGGRFFAEPAESYLCGSSYGGNLLKVSWVGLGMRLEVMREGRRIVTSPVQSVNVLDDTSLPGPF
ncbi:MAG TPA: hypothetical protein VGC53_14415 [Vicinamibacteria bacterium]|jgi:hypothetical protein